MSNKPLNSPEVTTKASTVTPSIVAVDTPITDTTTNQKSTPSLTAQPPTNDQGGSNNDPSGNGEFDPEFPIVAAVSEFTIEAAEEGIRARHDSGYVFEGTYAEFNRHARESIKLSKHA